MAQQLNASGSDAKLKPKTSSRVSSALKSGVVYGGSAVLTAVNNITPHIAGAVDILVIEQPDGSRKATPFYVRFGKYTALRTGERDVKLYVNDELAPFGMHIGMYGQAYFATDTVEVPAADEDEEQDALLAGMMSPPSGYSSGADDTATGPVDEASAGLSEEAREGSGSRRPNVGSGAALGTPGPRFRRGAHASPPALGSIPDSPSGEGGEGGGARPCVGGDAAVAAAGRRTAGVEVGPSLTASDRNESFLSARETLTTPLSDDIVSAALAAGLSSLGTGRPLLLEEPSNVHQATNETGEGWSRAPRMAAPPPLTASEGTGPSGWSDEEGEVEGGQSGRTGSSPVSYASPPDRARLTAMACGSENWSPVELPAASPMPGHHTQPPIAVQQTQQQQQQAQQHRPQPQIALAGISPHSVQQPLHQQLGFPENPSPVFQTVNENGAPPTVPALASATADAGKLPPLFPNTGVRPQVDWQQLLGAGKPREYSEIPAGAESSVISHAVSVTISTGPSGDAADAIDAGVVVAGASALRYDVSQWAAMAAPCGAEPLCTSPMKAYPGAEGPNILAAQVEGGAPASHGSAPHAAVSLLSSSLRVLSGVRDGSDGSARSSCGMVAAAVAIEAGPSGSAPRSSRPWPQAAAVANTAMDNAGAMMVAGSGSPQSLQLAAEYSTSTSPAALCALLPPGAATGVVDGGAAGAGACLGPIAAAAVATTSYCCTSSSHAIAVTLSPTPEGGVRLQLSVPPPLLSPLAAALPVDVLTAAAAADGTLDVSAAHGLLGASEGSVISVASGACDTDRPAADAVTVHGRSMSHTHTLAPHHPHAVLEHHLHSTSVAPPSSSTITPGLEAAAAVAAAPAAAAATSCALELSLCGGLLTRSMSHSEATALFEAHRLSEEVFAIRGPALLASPDLVVRLGDGAMYPWQALSYSLAGLLAFGTWRLPVDVVCWAPEGLVAGGSGLGLGPGTTAAAAVTALLSAVAQGARAAVSAQAGDKDDSGDGGNDGATGAAAVRCMTSVTTTPKKDATSTAVAGSAGAGTAGGTSGGSSWRLWMFGARRDSTGRTSVTGGVGTVTGKSPPGASSPERPGGKPSGGAVSAATSPPPLGATVAASAQSPTQRPPGPGAAVAPDMAAAEAAPVGSSAGGGGSGGAGGPTAAVAVGGSEGSNRSGLRGAHGRSRRQGYNVVTKKSLTPAPEQLAALPLKHGQNTIVYKIGGSELKAYVYYLPWRTKIVISDIDGTITRSDVLGHLLPAMGLDWSHPGIAQLLTNIRQNNYLIMYLSSRSISQANITRDFINTLVQGEHRMPLGPVIISPHGLLPSLYREMILRRPHEFKIATLQDIRALFPPHWNPFYGGFGNRDTDEISYREVGVLPNRIFIINPRGELRQPKDHTTATSSESNQPSSDRDTGTDSGTESGAADTPTAMAPAAGSGSGTSPGSDVLTGEGPGPSTASASGPLAPALTRNAGSINSRKLGTASTATASGGPTALSSLSAINDFVHHIFPPVTGEMSEEGELEGAAVGSGQEEGAAEGEESARAAEGDAVEMESSGRHDSRHTDDVATENEGHGADGGSIHSSGKLARELAGSSAALGYTTAAQSAEDLVAWGVAWTPEDNIDIAVSAVSGLPRMDTGEEPPAAVGLGVCDSTSAASTPLAACSPRGVTATTSSHNNPDFYAQEAKSEIIKADALHAGAINSGDAVLDEAREGGVGCFAGASSGVEGRWEAAAAAEASDALPPASSSLSCLPSLRSSGLDNDQDLCRRLAAELSSVVEGGVTGGPRNGFDGGDYDAVGQVHGSSVRGVTVRVPVRDGGAGEGDSQPPTAAAAAGVTSPKARLSGSETSVMKGVAATA